MLTSLKKRWPWIALTVAACLVGLSLLSVGLGITLILTLLVGALHAGSIAARSYQRHRHDYEAMDLTALTPEEP